MYYSQLLLCVFSLTKIFENDKYNNVSFKLPKTHRNAKKQVYPFYMCSANSHGP